MEMLRRKEQEDLRKKREAEEKTEQMKEAKREIQQQMIDREKLRE